MHPFLSPFFPRLLMPSIFTIDNTSTFGWVFVRLAAHVDDVLKHAIIGVNWNVWFLTLGL